ncbi:MAG TPA: methyltransferase domain-containing protein [Candidatus Saccharimonadales bacterium]|nr:methyltransferase domain-containing protein [Candidatus Saccharimonadales bacterium]
MHHNERTLATYETTVPRYIDGSPNAVSGPVKDWVDMALTLVPENAHILEVGTALGYDADYMEARGYQVDRTDATRAFVDLQRERGHDVQLLNLLTADNLGGPYDMVHANAVLLHFTPEELAGVLDKIALALCGGGILTATLKRGRGAAWSTEKLDQDRYFQYWEADDIRALLEQKDFHIISPPDLNDQKWLRLIARKGTVK